MTWFATQGELVYGPGIRAIIGVDQQISDYYRAMIPKYKVVYGQRHPAHITVVRIGLEIPANMSVWEKHQRKLVKFEYSNFVEQDGVYWFIRVRSDEIAEIRKELGLPKHFDKKKGYHLTLGNTK